METSRRDITKIKKQIAALTEQLDSLVDSGTEDASAYLEDMQEKLGSIADQVREYSDVARTKAKKAVKQADDYAHENPWHLVAAGAAVALIAGLIMNRRNDR